MARFNQHELNRLNDFVKNVPGIEEYNIHHFDDASATLLLIMVYQQQQIIKSLESILNDPK